MCTQKTFSRSALSAVWLTFVCLPVVASAHHTVSEFGISWAEPVTVLEGSMEWAGFDRDGESGQYWVNYSLRICPERRLFHLGADRVRQVFWTVRARVLDSGTVRWGQVRGLQTEHGELVSVGLNLESRRAMPVKQTPVGTSNSHPS